MWSSTAFFCTTFTGFQSTHGLTTRFQPCASTLSPTLLLSISLSFYPPTPLSDISVHPCTHTPSIFLSSELSHLVKVHFSSQVKLYRIYCLMDSNTLNLLLHLKQLSKLISSDLHTNLLYLLGAVCVVVCVCVCVCVWACSSNHTCVCSWCWVWISACRQCDVRVVRNHVFQYCCNCYAFCC